MVAIIDYGVGNLFSVAKAFESLGAKAIVTGNEEEIRNADKIVLPGVGAFGDCMENLGKSGLIPVIKETAASGRPFLGICVGLQILFEVSEESPKAKGLGILKGNVRRIDAPSLKIPHMGWNAVTYETKNETAAKLFAGLPQEAYFYFVHSYHAMPTEESIIAATTDYGGKITAAVGRGNLAAAQFHPEKSGDVGLKVIENFLVKF